MKLAAIGDEISQDLDAALALVWARRFGGIEIRSVWNTPPHRLTAAQCRRIRDRVAAAGVELIAYDSPAFKHALPRTRREREGAVRLLDRSLAVARALGGPPVRVFSFYREGPARPEAAAEEMAAALDRVDHADLRLLLENGTRTNSPTAAGLATLLELLGPRLLGALWDPGNAAFSGLEPAPAPGIAGRLGRRLELVHVKDPCGRRRYTRLGHGDLRWGEIVADLGAAGFSGHLSLETHWRLGRELSAAERDRPWGEAFSRGAHLPTAICMEALRRLVAPGGEQPERR